MNAYVALDLVVFLLSATALGQNDWARTTPESAGLGVSRLSAMEAAIKAGEFKKIGSVLRDLAETVYDSDRSALERDLRYMEEQKYCLASFGQRPP
jgi:hypothetical protein